MKKELKDYLHLYLGCQVQYKFITIIEKLELRIGKLYGIKGSYCFLETVYGFKEERIEDVRPILRPLSDMTEEEVNEADTLQKFQLEDEDEAQVLNYALMTKFLLSKRFDLFGLIESELAIDKTTLK